MHTDKTIEYLNQKPWYRLLKVVYIFTCIGLVVMSVFLITEEERPYDFFDNNNSYILCEDGRKLGLDENNIYLSDSFVLSFQDESIKKMCANNAIDPDSKKSLDEIFSPRMERLKKIVDGSDYVPAEKNYKIVPVYEMRGSWVLVFGYYLLAIVIITLALEIFKRIFYYIVLGKIFPKKF